MSWDDIHDTRKTFRSCLRAQCAPGAIIDTSPGAGLVADPALDLAAGVLLTLTDQQTSVGGSGVGTHELLDLICRRTGAVRVPEEEADFVLVTEDAAGAIGRARRGSRERPEEGATVLAVTVSTGTPVSLTGPGIESVHETTVPLDVAALEARDAAIIEPPTGVDLLVFGPEGIRALPRTTRVAVRADRPLMERTA